MKILICGANGQLGNEFRALAPGCPEHAFIFTDVAELNICDQQSVSDYILTENPEVVINCAAFTAVDKAESEPAKAFLLNRDAAGFLAEACKNHHAFFIHVSTDYVFDGNAVTPYQPGDPTIPTSVYGASKLAGEQAIQAIQGNALIIRTAWLYSSYGNNFVKTMLRLAKERGEVRVVADQKGSPTYARDLAQAILWVLNDAPIQGVQVLHYANAGTTTWFGFAQAIFEYSGVPCNVLPVTSAEFPTPVKRPAYSVLDTSAFTRRYKRPIPAWQDSLRDCLSAIQQKDNK